MEGSDFVMAYNKIYKMKYGDCFYYGTKAQFTRKMIDELGARKLNGNPYKSYKTFEKGLNKPFKTNLNGKIVLVDEVSYFEF